MTSSPTRKLREAGQSLWLDNSTRKLLTSGTLERYIDELGITGLTSNPTIFDLAISKSADYDASIVQKTAAGTSTEQIFFDLKDQMKNFPQLADRAQRLLRHLNPDAVPGKYQNFIHASSC